MVGDFDSGRADFPGVNGCPVWRAVRVACWWTGWRTRGSCRWTGAKVAAATAVEMRVESVGHQPLVMVVDRPFVFLIQDRATEAVTFMGRLAASLWGAFAQPDHYCLRTAVCSMTMAWRLLRCFANWYGV